MKDLFKSPYNAFKADALDILPIVGGTMAGVITSSVGGPGVGLFTGVYLNPHVKEKKDIIETDEK